MRDSLLFRLMGAFLLVIAIGSLVISVLTSQATQSAFNLYTTRSGQVWAQRLAPLLADYFVKTGSWQGVNEYLASGVLESGAMGMGSGMGQGRGMGVGRQAADPAAGMGAMGAMGQRLIVVDANGRVIGDTQNEWVGRQMSAADLNNGTGVTVNAAQVGTLIVTPNDVIGAGSPAGDFLTSVNSAIVSSALIAGVIALAIGALLFFQITAPVRQLKKAAAAIAHGDLSQRVQIRSRDEFGELGQTFNRMAENLASAEIQRQHMAADVAHELRTPLAAIQATLEGMQDGVLPLDEEQLAALYSETILLNRLVGDLRLLTLAEAGQLKLEMQPAVTAQFLLQAVERIRHQAVLKNITLKTDLEAGLPDVWLDVDRMNQVLTNLIGNALRYTPEQGTITVSAGQDRQTPGNLLIAVTDNGSGISSDVLPFVFDRFYRGDKSRSRSSGGSGLGLAIVRQLVEAHAGTVRAESPVFSEGFGTRITVCLPIHHYSKN